MPFIYFLLPLLFPSQNFHLASSFITRTENYQSLNFFIFYLILPWLDNGPQRLEIFNNHIFCTYLTSVSCASNVSQDGRLACLSTKGYQGQFFILLSFVKQPKKFSIISIIVLDYESVPFRSCNLALQHITFFEYI